MAQREIDMSVPCKTAWQDWLNDNTAATMDCPAPAQMEWLQEAFAAGWQARKEAVYRALVTDGWKPIAPPRRVR